MQLLFSEVCVSKRLELSAYAAAVPVRSVLTPCNKLLMVSTAKLNNLQNLMYW